MSKKKKDNWDGNFDDIPLQGKILEDHYQGVTEDHATTHHGDKRLPAVGDPRTFDSVDSNGSKCPCRKLRYMSHQL